MLRSRTMVGLFLCAWVIVTSAQQVPASGPGCPDLQVAKNAGNLRYLNAAMCRVMVGDANARAIGFAILREEAKGDNIEAELLLSSALRGVPDSAYRNEAESLRLLESLVERGFVKAKGSLGAVLLIENGVEQDLQRAERLLNEAAKAGDSNAIYNLFMEYRQGFRLPRDLNRSDALLAQLRKSKEQVAFMSLRSAEVFLAEEEANETKLKAQAEAGNFQAQYFLGKRSLAMHQFEEALKWLQKAADQNFVFAINELGNVYDQGLGVERSPVQAAKLHLKAAELGHLKSQMRLADRYFTGDGVARSAEHGLFWLKVAALVGSNKAAADFKTRAAQQPTELVMSAQAKAEEYVRLHPEFFKQKDGSHLELRIVPRPGPKQ